MRPSSVLFPGYLVSNIQYFSSDIDLPADFLSTPFGAALRPTIDRMFRGPIPSAAPTPPPIQPPSRSQPAPEMNPELTSALVQAIARQAPGVVQITKPDTEKDAELPVHRSIEERHQSSTAPNAPFSRDMAITFGLRFCHCPGWVRLVPGYVTI